MQSFWHIISFVFLVPVILYGCIITAMVVFQPRLIYFPYRKILSTPIDIGLPYVSVLLETSDGVKIHSWFVPAEQSRGVVLFCHGNAGNISYRLDSIKIFNKLRLSTLIFDYRGYGQSGGNISEEGTYLDAGAAWNHLVYNKQIPPNKIIIFGRSLGGAIATWLAQNHKPNALIVESAFTSITDVGVELYPFIPRWISRFHYNTKEYLQNVNCPVLIIHSRGDDLIPFQHGLRLFESAPSPKKFLEISGDHNDGFYTSGKSYIDGIDSFVSSYTIGTE